LFVVQVHFYIKLFLQLTTLL